MTSWVPGWIAKKVQGVSVLEDSVPRAVFSHQDEVIPAYVIAQSSVSGDDVRGAMAAHNDLRFIVNTTKDADYEGAALNLCEQHRVGLGDLSEFISFVGYSPRDHIQREARFLLRTLRQHSAVRNVARENNSMYVVARRNMTTQHVLILSDYLVTAESVRTGLDRFGVPSVIAKSNPNGTVTNEAREAAASAGLSILTWSELLGRLRRQ